MMSKLIKVFALSVCITGCERVNRAIDERKDGEDRWTALAPMVPLVGLFKYEDEHVICYLYEDNGSAMQCFRK